MAGLVLVTGPAEEPISLDEAKLYLRIGLEQATEDDLLNVLIAAARSRAEERQGRAYLTQTWDLFLDAFPIQSEQFIPVPWWSPCDPSWGVTSLVTEPWIEVPRAPLQSVTSITYTKSDGTPVVMPTSDYYVDTASQLGRIYPNIGKAWPSDALRVANGVAVRFVAGYGSVETIPEQRRGVLLQLLAHYYEHRDLDPGIPQGIDEQFWEGYARQFA